MKKALLIMAAALMTMTQCRKQETTPVTPAADTIRMTITAGPGRTDINTADGSITWSAGDKLYVSKNGSWLGSLTLVSGENTANGTFAGDVTGIGDGDTPCHFFYLGHDNGMTQPTGTAAANISLAAQDGTLAGAMKYHLGYGRTDVTVTEGEATGAVVMDTKIAIAHINFTTDGATAYTKSVNMGGTGISNTMTVSPNGSFSGGDDGGIAIGNGNGTTGERYVTLIPTETTDVLGVAFTGDATGGMTFANGIEANKFYGMSHAMEVTLEASAPASVFTVDKDAGTTVEFAPGNLYWDGGAFHFESSQWSSADTWNASHVSHFKWSDATNAVTDDDSYSGDLFCKEDFTVDGKTWRTLTKDEWVCLMNTRPTSTNLGTANARYALVKVKGVCGMMLFPDTFTWPASVSSMPTTFNTYQSNWNSVDYSTEDFGKLESAGVVFLPAAGYRGGSSIYRVGSYGSYWSSTYGGSSGACSLYFYSVYVNPQDASNRDFGYSVRLVR